MDGGAAAERGADETDEDGIYRQMFDAIDRGFCLIEVLFDETGKPVDYVFLAINKVFEEATGLRDAVGRRMREMAPDHEDHWFSIYGEIALTGVAQRFQNPARALGRWYDVFAFRVGEPRQHRVGILFDDITARRRTEEALQESEARYRRIFENINEGFTVLELLRDSFGLVYDARYLEVAPSVYALTGRRAEDMIGKTVIEVFGTLDEPWLRAFQSVGWGAAVQAENWSPAVGKWFRASLTPLGHDRISVLFSDVTEHYRRERELQAARRKAENANLSKSKFLAAASHDLRQPVQSLILFNNALSVKLGDHPAQAVVTKMSSALDTFTDLLDSLLDLSKFDAGQIVPEMKPCQVQSVLDDMILSYQPRMADKGLRFKVRMCDAWACLDPNLFRRIVGNLLDNALKYTKDGGVLLSCRVRGDRICIDVVDSGVGIAPDHQEEIFTEFVQISQEDGDKAHGLGLGLATVKRLADLLGYEISVRSINGRGTRFRIVLPAVREPDGAR